MKKIGFFGGTFDPIHFGHINLALELLEQCDLDEVWFCPARQSPFKASQPVVSAPDRAEMVGLAIEGISPFRLCSIELQRPGLSYTFDTLRAIQEDLDLKKEKLFLLLSEDAISQFHRWKEFEQIVAIAPPLIGTRGERHPKIPPSPVQKILQKGLVPTHRLDISSTQIRQRLKKGLYCGHLCPAKVIQWIEKKQLYAQ